MGERKSYEYLNRLKKKLGVDVIYSWSRYHLYTNDPYGYMLKYIKRVPEVKKDSIYGVSGGICHDILERLYLGEIKREDMLDEYENKLFEMNLSNLKYDRIDEDKNKSIAEKYEGSIRMFFQDYKPLKGKCILEQFVTIKVGRFIFQGYIDFLHKIDGNYIIEDFKTSTIYTGKKLIGESGQLILYAESLIQKGVPLDKIKVRYNFLKYCEVETDLVAIDKETKKNKTKSKNCVRYTWVKDNESNLRKWLSKGGYDELEIEDMVQTCIENNNLNTLPQDIQDRFRIKDCYVYLDLTQETIDDLKSEIIDTLEDVENKTNEVNIILKEIEKSSDKKHIKQLENKVDELFWTDIDKAKEYYFYNLCGYSRQQHRCWDEYLKDANLFREDNFDSEFESKNTDDEFDWLKDL